LDRVYNAVNRGIKMKEKDLQIGIERTKHRIKAIEEYLEKLYYQLDILEIDLREIQTKKFNHKMDTAYKVYVEDRENKKIEE